MINTRELAKKLAVQDGLQRAERYDLFLRDFDHKVELIGLVQDPTYDMKDFYGREMLFPKRWITLAVYDENTTVTV